MRIRPATAADVPAIFHVRTSVDDNVLTESELADRGITPSVVADMLRGGASRAWCAEVSGEVVGFSLARASERDIFALFVLPAHHSQGLGSALLDCAVGWLRDNGDAPIRLRTGATSPALRFYRNRGWRETGQRDGDDVVLELRDADDSQTTQSD